MMRRFTRRVRLEGRHAAVGVFLALVAVHAQADPFDQFTSAAQEAQAYTVAVVACYTDAAPGAAHDLPAATGQTEVPHGSNEARRAAMLRGFGSGFVIDPAGLILTNAHVVRDASRIEIHFADGHEVPARVLGADALTDVALLKIDTPAQVAAARLGDSAALRLGQWVMAIGSPYGFEGSVSTGIVSKASRDMPGSSGTPLIQTDIALHPGYSGGPLIGLNGEVVGINTMIVSTDGSQQGIALAVPINQALAIAHELEKNGFINRGSIGVRIQDVTPALAQAFHLPSRAGALVTWVEPDSPAGHAGLQAGDVIVGVDPGPDESLPALQADLAATPAGVTLGLRYIRAAQLARVTLRVSENARGLTLPPTAVAWNGLPRLGLELRERAAGSSGPLGLNVLRSQGAAQLSGIRSGDTIVAVGDTPVTRLADFDRLIDAISADTPIALLVVRDGAYGYIAVQ